MDGWMGGWRAQRDAAAEPGAAQQSGRAQSCRYSLDSLIITCSASRTGDRIDLSDRWAGFTPAGELYLTLFMHRRSRLDLPRLMSQETSQTKAHLNVFILRRGLIDWLHWDTWLNNVETGGRVKRSDRGVKKKKIIRRNQKGSYLSLLKKQKQKPQNKHTHKKNVFISLLYLKQPFLLEKSLWHCASLLIVCNVS